MEFTTAAKLEIEDEFLDSSANSVAPSVLAARAQSNWADLL